MFWNQAITLSLASLYFDAARMSESMFPLRFQFQATPAYAQAENFTEKRYFTELLSKLCILPTWEP